MSASDYLIDVLLIALVLRQVRARELTAGSVLLPTVLVGVACLHYVHAFTPRGNDALLIALLAATGVVLGLLSGVATDVWRAADGRVVARAGLAAAFFWVAGMGFRFGFAVWSTGSGAAVVTRFSRGHRISSGQAWTTALVLMAVGEVLARVAILQLRRVRARRPGVPWDESRVWPRQQGPHPVVAESKPRPQQDGRVDGEQRGGQQRRLDPQLRGNRAAEVGGEQQGS
jgi:hypothetical protein